MRSDEEIDVSELAEQEAGGTELLTGEHTDRRAVRVFRLLAVEGPEAGKAWQSSSERFAVGSHPSNDVVLDDGAVSRFHCELRVDRRGAWIKDLDSRNGSLLDGVPLGVGGLREGSLIRLGRSVLRFHFGSEQAPLLVSSQTSFGKLVGTSVAMRSSFALLERAADTDVTVLLEGETGTGKEAAAEAVHEHSARRNGPFVIVDCSAMPAGLLESELFGHERGAFTGASGRRIGAFEEANGGTVFLDEIGELPPELQPKLLRVLERKQIRRIGENVHRAVDVRLVAATNRDLRAQVNQGSFRSDVYFRLAVLKVPLPPLRERPEDIPALVQRFIPSLGIDEATAARLFTPDFLGRLARAAWPGNVRELRNTLERCVVLQEALPVQEASNSPHDPLLAAIDPSLTYSDAKRRVLDSFERHYLQAVLELHRGNVSRAARASGMDRVYMYKLLRRHGLRG